MLHTFDYIPLKVTTAKFPEMTRHGCYGVRIGGTDKLAYCGSNSQPSILGLEIIRDLNATISRVGYVTSMTMWKQLAHKLITNEHQSSLDPLTAPSIQNMLSRGRIYERKDFMLDSYACQWAYIMNLDNESLEIYKGEQTQIHTRGRWSHLRLEEVSIDDDVLPGFTHMGHPSHLRQKAFSARKTYYPCALFEIIPLNKLQDFDPRAYLIDDTALNTGNETII